MSCQKKNKSKIQVKKSKSKIQVKKSKTRKHRGGSYASDLVMAASKGPVVMDDYVASPRIRNGPNADHIGLDMISRGQEGGSAASNMTMKNLDDIATTNKYTNGWKVTGDINSLNTYQPSGGERKSKNSKSNKHKHNHKSKNSKSNKHNHKSKNSNNKYKNNNTKSSKRNKNSNHNHNQNKNKNRIVKGGASDYMASYYSLDSNIKRPNFAWDPPTRDLAGSGAAMGSNEGANVSRVGSPLV